MTAKRLLEDARCEDPYLKLIVLEDRLAAYPQAGSRRSGSRGLSGFERRPVSPSEASRAVEDGEGLVGVDPGLDVIEDFYNIIPMTHRML